jgi:hypothetical protein
MIRNIWRRSAPWLILAALGLGVRTAPSQTNPDMKHEPTGTLQVDMRKLWEDHVSWTRMYIMSATSNLPDKAATLDRLLRNQDDIGNAVKPFYGDSAGQKLTELLKDHIRIAGEVVDAAAKSDNAKVQDASKRWTANADQIAVFLSGANPANWPVERSQEDAPHPPGSHDPGSDGVSEEGLEGKHRDLRQGPRPGAHDGRCPEQRHHEAVPSEGHVDRTSGRPLSSRA